MNKKFLNHLIVSLCLVTSTVLFTSCPQTPDKPDPTNKAIDRTISVKNDFTSFNNGTNNKYYNLGNNPGSITVTADSKTLLYGVWVNSSYTPLTPTIWTDTNYPRNASAPVENHVATTTNGPVNFHPTSFFNKVEPLAANTSRFASTPSLNVNTDPIIEYPDTRDFWDYKDNSSSTYTENDWEKISAVKVAENDICVVYVDVADYKTSSNANGLVTQELLENLATEFEKLYALETSIFGEQYEGSIGTDWERTLIADNKKIIILVQDIDNDNSGRPTSGIYGYFWDKDFYREDSNQKNTGNLKTSGGRIVKTNEAEMFYIDSWFLVDDTSAMYSTLAHEFQHMLHFINKTIVIDEYSDDWFNEMLSMLCEDLLIKHFEESLGNAYSRLYHSPFRRIPYFNADYNINSPLSWDSTGVRDVYATTYVFGAWLARNYGGVDFVKQLASNNFTGTYSITDALRQLGYEENFETVFLEYALSMAQPNADEVYLNKTVGENTDTPLYPIDLWSIYFSWYEKTKNNYYPMLYLPAAEIQKNIDAGNYLLGPWNHAILKKINTTLNAWDFSLSSMSWLLNLPYYPEDTVEFTFTPSFNSNEHLYLIAIQQ